MRCSPTAFAVLAGLVALCGCRERRESSAVTVTNTVVRTVTVTNTVSVTQTVTVTNVVVERHEPPRALTVRRTAPYRVSAQNLGGAQLRQLLQGAGARVIACDSGAVAVVEAPDPVVAALRTGGVMCVQELQPADKAVPGTLEGSSVRAVRIVPLSSIDVTAVVSAVRSLDGELVQAVASGSPAVRAKVSGAAVRALAARGDVRLIERDDR